MNPSLHDEGWEDRLRAGLGEAPAPGLRSLAAPGTPTPSPPSNPHPSPIAPLPENPHDKFKVDRRVAALLLGALLLRSEGSLGRKAFAETIPGDRRAQRPSPGPPHTTSRVTSADRQEDVAPGGAPSPRLPAPGPVPRDLAGQGGPAGSHRDHRRPGGTDARAGSEGEEGGLESRPADIPTSGGRSPGSARRSAIAWSPRRCAVKSVSLQGAKEIDRIQANVVRAMIDEGDDRGPARRDFLFDRKSKRLVAIYVTNENDFDPETAPERNRPPRRSASMSSPVAGWEHEIVLDPKLDAADFSLDPPAGYAYETIAKPTITEEEMVAFLGPPRGSTTASSPTRRTRRSTRRSSTRPA